jgi:hypothetical protein
MMMHGLADLKKEIKMAVPKLFDLPQLKLLENVIK